MLKSNGTQSRVTEMMPRDELKCDMRDYCVDGAPQSGNHLLMRESAIEIQKMFVLPPIDLWDGIKKAEIRRWLDMPEGFIPTDDDLFFAGFSFDLIENRDTYLQSVYPQS